MREDRTLFLFVFCDEYLLGDSPSNDEERKSVLTRVFANVGWECTQILAAMASVGNIYFDRVSQIRLGHWTKARTALVGDAAACVSLLAGQGSILAMAEAYVLAGELHNCGGDFDAAFTGYEQRLMPLLKRKQKSAAKFASSFAPKTALGIAYRNLVTRLMVRLPFVMEYFIGREIRDQVELPDYGF
jgi:2-polyprenyl-6-methoxyphenol hydroxylase-like FAD-dependent oxidoreductase